jgi:hypothetical protein
MAIGRLTQSNGTALTDRSYTYLSTMYSVFLEKVTVTRVVKKLQAVKVKKYPQQTQP